MTQLEKFIVEQISPLIQPFEQLDVCAYIDDFSYSVEFFVTIGGNKMQCYDMVDTGLIEEEKLDKAFVAIATTVRQLPEYKQETIYSVSMCVNMLP